MRHSSNKKVEEQKQIEKNFSENKIIIKAALDSNDKKSFIFDKEIKNCINLNPIDNKIIQNVPIV